MKSHSHLIIVLLLLFLSCFTNRSFTAVPNRPHIVFILADDLGFADLGYRGVADMKTPNIDKLAQEGVKLENYYVQPLCSPTRSQLLTGRYQIHTGLQHDLISPCQNNSIPQDLPTLPSALKKLNYSTNMIGKWHLGLFRKEVWPLQMGFESFFGYLAGDEDYYTHIHCYNFKNNQELSTSPTLSLKKSHLESNKVLMCGKDFRDGEKPVAEKYEGQYSTHLFAGKAKKIIKKHAETFGPNNKEHPLFLYLPFQAVHSPLQVPERYLIPFQSIKDKNRRNYAGLLYCLDEAIGNITNSLKKHGMWNDTLLIFSTDNGGQILHGGNNYPLRGWKYSLWEGGVKAAGFVNGPGLRGLDGGVSRALMHVTDWYPTLLKMAGIDDLPGWIDGFDVGGALFSKEPSPRHEILHNIDPLTAFRGREANFSTPFDIRVMAGIRYKNWKLLTGNPGNGSWIVPPEKEGETNSTSDPDPSSKNLWLFDLDNDPTESQDLSSKHQDVLQFLLDRLSYYNSTAVPVRYPSDDPRCDPKFHGGYWAWWW